MSYKKKYNKKAYGHNVRTVVKYKKRKLPMFGRADRWVGRKAFWLAKKALRHLNVEYKHFDLVAEQTVSTTASIIQLTNIPNGDTDVTRDGAQCKIVRIQTKYFAEISQSDDAAVLRVMLVQDRQTNGAIFAIGDLLESTGADDALISPYNIDNKYRFNVLYDHLHTLSKGASNDVITASFFKDCSIMLRFNNSTPAIQDLDSNSLALVFISDNPTNQVTVNYYTRLRFVDN